MSKERPTVGTDGRALPVLPPERDARVWARLVRVMFYTPGFLALLLLKAGEPTGFGITVELLMLSSAAAIVGGLFIGTQSEARGADFVPGRRLERGAGARVAGRGAVPVRRADAVPRACEQHAAAREGARAPSMSRWAPPSCCRRWRSCRSCSTSWPASARCTSSCPKPANWVINIAILGLIVAAYVANRAGATTTWSGLVGAAGPGHGASCVFYGDLQAQADAGGLRSALPAQGERARQVGA